MVAVLFDTHEAVKELQDAGVDPAAAEAVVGTVRRGLGENVATRADLAELRTELKADLAALDPRLTRTKAEIAGEFKNLYKHLRLMGASIIGPTVTFTKVLS